MKFSKMLFGFIVFMSTITMLSAYTITADGNDYLINNHAMVMCTLTHKMDYKTSKTTPVPNNKQTQKHFFVINNGMTLKESDTVMYEVLSKLKKEEVYINNDYIIVFSPREMDDTLNIAVIPTEVDENKEGEFLIGHCIVSQY